MGYERDRRFSRPDELPPRTRQAFREFVRAASNLSDSWHRSLSHGYPQDLPSFDELTNDFLDWYEKHR